MAKTALEITDEEMAVYRATARRQVEIEKHWLAQRLEQAQTVAKQAAQILRQKFGTHQVILFGSAAQGVHFHPRSDIDLAVEGIAPKEFWRAWSALDAVTHGFEIDLVDIETASPVLSLEIERQGVAL